MPDLTPIEIIASAFYETERACDEAEQDRDCGRIVAPWPEWDGLSVDEREAYRRMARSVAGMLRASGYGFVRESVPGLVGSAA